MTGPTRYVRSYECEDCGKATQRARGRDQPLICADCSTTRVAEAARQMHEHKGPAYDRWRMTAGPRGRPGTP